jgi:hypothetical protein
MSLPVALAVAAFVTLASLMAGCGSSGPDIRRVTVTPTPEGPGPLVASADGTTHARIPISEISRALPAELPTNPPQRCAFGARVTLTLVSGKRLSYGPCALPPSIERLRVAIIRAADGRRHRETAPPLPEAFRAVLKDWFDGRMDSWHSCGAVEEAMKHLPTGGPISRGAPFAAPTVSDAWRDLRAYARAVC